MDDQPLHTADEPAAVGPADGGSAGALMAAFTLTTFLSAVLLFSIQPLFAKMVLPVLGGSPSVWAVALCFFQAALLAGYGYAHLLGRYVDRGKSGLVHLGVCAIAVAFLPIAIPSAWRDPPPGDPSLWQLGLFTCAVGLPFVAVAANAPLLQFWFARSGHRQARDPYFLYAASNLGSMLALIGYPLVLEPMLGARAMSRLWAVGFVVLAAAIGGCFWLVGGRAAGAGEAPPPEAAGPSAAPAWSERLRWVGLALVPSALLTAFTTHVATDVASAPLVWVIPLALYLLTFVIVFRDRALIPPRLLLIAHLAAVILALLQLSQTRHDGWFVSSSAGVLAFFTSALVAHRTLYDARPDARHLTEFYLWMSFGGVLGGLFAALIAPHLFSEVFEYPLLLALTMACRPRALQLDLGDKDEMLQLWLVLAGGLLALYWFPWAITRLNDSVAAGGLVPPLIGPIRAFINNWGVAAIMTAGLSAAMLAAWRHPARQLVLALLIFGAVTTQHSAVRRGDAQRSYFGVYRVMSSGDDEFMILTHGTTLHGAQRVRDADGALVLDTTPGTYYYPNSPMAHAVEIVRKAVVADGRKPRFGVVGLGAGSLSCYKKDDESWRFFEIDPTVIGIASNPEKFSFLHYCMPEPDIVLGDARLTLSKEPPASYDLIILDAFSSDAVPMHLMTAEALAMYASKLTPSGVVLLHISNRYLDLDRVLGATAPLVPELHGLLVSDDAADGSYASSTSTVAVFSKSAAAIEPFREAGEPRELEPGTMRGWTDDYSDVLRPFLSKMKR